MARTALVTALLLLLVVPPAAHAGTLRASTWEWEYTAAPGEANDVTARVTRPTPYGSRTRLRDDGAPIFVDAPPGVCDIIDPHEVDCFWTGRILTGDGDDRVRVSGEPAAGIVWLGPGDDVGEAGWVAGEDGDDELTGASLEGGEGADRLTLTPALPRPSASGGPGDDVMTGTDLGDAIAAHGGSDVVRAGRGDDTVFDGVPPDVTSSDDLDGGEGHDLVAYDRATAVRVDLVDGSAGSPGERDSLRGFEAVRTGSGDDVLIGTPGPDVLDGGRGGDRIEGGAGDDLLTAGWGDDVVTGGPGDDVLDGDEHNDPTYDAYGAVVVHRDPDRDLLDGGEGDDTVLAAGDRWVDRAECGAGADDIGADTVDDVATSCEAVRRHPLPSLFRRHRVVRGPWVRVTVRTAAVEVPCEIASIGGVVALRRGRHLLGRRRWRCVPDPDARLLEPSHGLRVGLGRRTLRRLRRRGRLAVTVVMGWDTGSVRSRDRTALVLRR